MASTSLVLLNGVLVALLAVGVFQMLVNLVWSAVYGDPIFAAPPPPPAQRGSLSIELTVAVGILVTVLMPLSLCFPRELAALHLFHHAVAMEIVDGETEVLRAGEWRAFAAGSPVLSRTRRGRHRSAARPLVLTLTNGVARLEWLPDAAGTGGRVVRVHPQPGRCRPVSPPTP